MDKNKLKTFAVESRRQLIEDTTYQANLLGITKDSIQDPVEEAEGMQAFDIGGSKLHVIYDDDIKKRASLVKEVNDKGFDNVIEEVAYTWFNRIIAIRYMEINDYLPTRVRVLSSETPSKNEPDIIKESLNLDLNLNLDDKKFVYKLKDKNKLDELFNFLFLKQCNKLNEILPELFEKTEDYTELLLNLSYIDKKGIICHLINDISEEDFKNQVEIIGWLYQYYNIELNNLVYDGSFKKKRIPKELLPAATQLFTPDWPVKYMVENSLGKLWMEYNPNDNLQDSWKYYVSNENLTQKDFNINPEDIKLIDPCMGSGHILLYAFDIFLQIYEKRGYSQKDAVILILEKNLYGLDIDERTYQLAYFSLLMKARKYNSEIFEKSIKNNLCSIKESNNLYLNLFNLDNEEIKNNLLYILNIFKDAKEYGSIINVKNINFNSLKNYLNELKLDSNHLIDSNMLNQWIYLVKQAEILSNQYDVVVTNPPYLTSKKFSPKLLNYVQTNYKMVKSDLITVFFKRTLDSLSKKGGYISFISTKSWMFLKSSQKFREYVVDNIQFDSIIDFGTELFEGKIGHNSIIAWTNKNSDINYNLIAVKLSNYNYKLRNKKHNEFFNKNNYYIFNQNDFSKIPGTPIAYWADKNLINSFKIGVSLEKIAEIRQGLATGDNNRFLRLWFEVNFKDIGFNYKSCDKSADSGLKWFPHNKGGKFQKWYGNQDLIINWENNGKELKNFKKSGLKNLQYNFKKSLSWSKVSSGKIAFRYYPDGFLFDDAAGSIFLNKNFNYIFGFLNSNVSSDILDFISPTINYTMGHISSLPIIFDEKYLSEINDLVSSNIKLCKYNWEDYETSWNFKSHPFLRFEDHNLKKIFNSWLISKQNSFNSLKSNEEKLNNIFSEIYNVQIDCIVPNKQVSINTADYVNDTKSFLSYAVGCIFGRYNLDGDGLIFAGGNFELYTYLKFVPDEDNIVPILDSEYFNDDIVNKFVDFVRVCFGDDYLEENLDFIAGALKNNGSTSREVIRNYFLNDFFKDHVKMYQKCPIYWLFDSGKENGFKCLIYMHRYTPDLVARVRTDYLHKTQKAIESQIFYEQNIKENSSNSKDQARADKRIKKLTKQLDETRRYDEALAHVASQNISIDLDDGVKVNYAKFQNVEVSKEGQKVKKINLLKKI